MILIFPYQIKLIMGQSNELRPILIYLFVFYNVALLIFWLLTANNAESWVPYNSYLYEYIF